MSNSSQMRSFLNANSNSANSFHNGSNLNKNFSYLFVSLLLALLAIFSSNFLPESFTNQLIMGIPAILVLWLFITFSICLLTMYSAMQMIKQLASEQKKTSMNKIKGE